MDVNIVNIDKIDEIISAYDKDQRYALAMMQDLQRAFQYVPKEGLEAIAEHLSCSVASLYAMATFYKALSLKPKGKHIIKVCDGTACHLKGAPLLMDAVERELNIKPEEVTEDGEFSMEAVHCLGSCALAPAMIIDDVYYGKVTIEKLKNILKEVRESDDAPGAPEGDLQIEAAGAPEGGAAV